jgi:Xaa-Pro aminopeptidase
VSVKPEAAGNGRGRTSYLSHFTEFSERRARFVESFGDAKIDAFLVTALPNVRYLSGFSGSNAALLLTADRSLLFTDPRYQTQAPQECDCDIKIAKKALLIEAPIWVNRLAVKRLGFERTRISFEAYDFLKRNAKTFQLVPVGDTIEQLRMVKSATEIATIRKAVELNSAAFDHALRTFKRGMTEVDLAGKIEYRMRRLGADGPSFETIVAAGPRTALPHAHPTARAIKDDELLLVDMGATVAGYASDMTRTMGVGRLSTKARRMYRAVLESQLVAIDSIKAGIASSTVDRSARTVLKKYGLDEWFIHSTGHGLGLEIHEGPRIGKKEARRLEAGMAITVEPGVYLEDFGGVRIEDTVIVTKNGCEVLTPTSKDLIIL